MIATIFRPSLAALSELAELLASLNHQNGCGSLRLVAPHPRQLTCCFSAILTLPPNFEVWVWIRFCCGCLGPDPSLLWWLSNWSFSVVGWTRTSSFQPCGELLAGDLVKLQTMTS